MSPLKGLMQKEMTRKEFLLAVGFGVASVLGISGLIRLLTGKHQHPHKHVTDGYGSTNYGGKTEGLQKRA
jgi:hypothetical protein